MDLRSAIVLIPMSVCSGAHVGDVADGAPLRGGAGVGARARAARALGAAAALARAPAPRLPPHARRRHHQPHGGNDFTLYGAPTVPVISLVLFKYQK